jgi:F-type H+-transporting ATPase subunit a
MRSLGALLLALTLAAGAAGSSPAAAQDHGAATTAQPPVAPQPGEPVSDAVVRSEEAAHDEHGAPAAEAAGEADFIMPHITDSRELELPYWKPPFYTPLHLPQGPVFHLGTMPLLGEVVVDLSPTKHVVFLLLAATLTALMLIVTARAHRRHHHAVGRPRGFAAGLEAVVLYLRDEVVMRNIPHGGARYAPFVLTLFFFILFANLLGLIPYGSTATGNISVTATLAIITFIVVETAGMRAQGAGYLKTIVYWPSDMPLMMKLPMTLIMTPVEIVGKLTKPFALAIRLFANMTAGHIVVLALVGLIFTFASLASVAPFLMAVAIMVLEIFVAFLQAFIFSLLASVFIGQMTEAHH